MLLKKNYDNKYMQGVICGNAGTVGVISNRVNEYF